MAEPLAVTFYSRPGCHLCEDAAQLLRQVAARSEMEVTVVDITADAVAYDRYWADIPVVAIGEYVLRAPITAIGLRAFLDEAKRAQS